MRGLNQARLANALRSKDEHRLPSLRLSLQPRQFFGSIHSGEILLRISGAVQS